MSQGVQPDPSLIGGVPVPPFVILPDPARVFALREARFAFLARSGNLAPYLAFLAALTGLQARLCFELPPVRASGHLDRALLAADPALHATLITLCAEAERLDMPDSARQALQAVALADAQDRAWLLSNVLDDAIPADGPAPHLFAALAAQVHLTRLAATLDAKALSPRGIGQCPACGGRPATSTVTGAPGIENIRYACCALCATQWNAVRITCLCCGQGGKISYRSAETTEATVKAECCGDCNSWVKILYASKNPTLDPIADDVGSLGLDLMMRESGLIRGGANPFLVGY
ncbi:formate dehydrogenase accessory protein FdhE [Neotabrizicola sp. sgz301269]|uniref:formate dehydrogenase accessory protein FdhE n=1 Tax=Neotabrizicola sp. sgz301269 TaxID=3276282 RepID=UPI0037700C1D